MKKIINLLKSRIREVTLIIVTIMVLLLFFSGCSMGKEYSSTNVEANCKIAEPILVVENDPIIEMDGKEKIKTYNFKVKNYKENGEVTQIDLNYNIEIISQKEEAISFKLYQEEQEIFLENNKTANIKLEKEQIQEDCYQLKIIYDQTKNNSIEDISQEVQIKVHSEQIRQ